MRDAIVIAIVTGALITGAICGIVGGALGICGAAIVIHRLADRFFQAFFLVQAIVPHSFAEKLNRGLKTRLKFCFFVERLL